jgi:hypothetical protein
VSGDARVSGEAQVFGEARVFGEAHVSDKARVNKPTLCLAGGAYWITLTNTHMIVGCKQQTYAVWGKYTDAMAKKEHGDSAKAFMKTVRAFLAFAKAIKYPDKAGLVGGG